MSSDKYILEGHQPKLVEDVLEWGKWFEATNRIVAKTKLDNGIVVSTVFLGLDHSFDGDSPLLFETMIFGGLLDQEMNRYSTWDEAEKGHLEMVRKANVANQGNQ